jgi:hypothetical protein
MESSNMAVSFIRASNPVWYFPDLEGLPLNDEYYAFFLTNVFPYVPQAVFQDPAGTIPWNNPIEFFPNGTLPDNLYFNDQEVYRIEIRHGNTQSDPLIYEINDFVPTGTSGGGGGGGTVSAGFGENQTTMSQFSEVLFSGTLHITTAGTYHVAAGWDLVLTGTGTADITQVPIAGDQNFINNPSYALGLNLNGWSTANLVQRFNHYGDIWASTLLSGIPNQDGYISMSITAQAVTSIYTPITFIYRPSSGGDITISSVPGTINTGSYQVYDQTKLLTPSLNSDTSATAFVDIVIQLLGTGNMLISNIQIVGQEVDHGSAVPLSPVYQQQTNERQIDHLFHYYRDSLVFQPKDTILTAWNFPLNPFQFVPTAITTIVNPTQYVADQTILHQEAASQIASGMATNADRFGLLVTPVAAATTTKFALIQYIDDSTTNPYWGYKLSALVRLRFNSTNNTTVRFKMMLMYRLTLPPTLSASDPIAGWAGDNLSLAAGWTAIKPLNDPIYSISHSSSTADLSYAFNGFQLPTASSDTMFLAAVFYTVDPMSSAGTKDFFVIDKISLVNNDFAIDTQPQTFDDVLRQCQFYYEKSYDTTVPVTTSTLVGIINKVQIGDQSNSVGYPGPFQFEFSTVKRAIPLFQFYSAVGTPGNVSVQTYRGGVNSSLVNVAPGSFWSAGNISTKSVEYLPVNNTPLASIGGLAAAFACSIRFHYTASILLGVN